jgi:hypothetical protein
MIIDEDGNFEFEDGDVLDSSGKQGTPMVYSSVAGDFVELDSKGFSDLPLSFDDIFNV